MKKLFLIAAVAFAAISCGSKPAEESQEAEAAPAQVQVVKEEAPAPAEAQPAQEEKEKSLIQRAVELGEDVAAEVEKQK